MAPRNSKKRKQSMDEKHVEMLEDNESSHALDSDDSDIISNEESDGDLSMDGPTNGHTNVVMPPSKKVKVGKDSLYKAPTTDELSQLNESEYIFQSSFLQMQVKELLKEVTCKQKRRAQVDSYIDSLLKELSRIKKQERVELMDQKWLKHVQVPFIQEPYECQGVFQFLPPLDLKMIGSFSLGLAIKPEFHVDIAVIMPKASFQKRDHLNHAYLRKRALYLAVIAAKLRKSSLVESLNFQYDNGNNLRPILVLKPSGELQGKLTIRLFPQPEEGVFKLSRFKISASNIRKKWYNGIPGDTLSMGAEIEHHPTPFYNTAILMDLAMEHCDEVLSEAIEDSPSIKDAICLLKVWLRQRQLDQGLGAFNGFIMSLYVTHLLHKHILSKTMSSYLVVRNTLKHLASGVILSKGIDMRQHKLDPNMPEFDEFKKVFDVVFVDPSGYVNVCADMCVATIKQVQQDAKLSCLQMENPSEDVFSMLFMTPSKFLMKYDQVFYIDLSSHVDAITERHNLDIYNMDVHKNIVRTCLRKILSSLESGLGDRIHQIGYKLMISSQWDINEAPLSPNPVIGIGILLNTENSNSIVIRGPPAETSQAADFREFWGSKSELRRFQDGGICEAVVFPSDTTASRRMISARMIKHILSTHFDIVQSSVKVVASQVEKVLHPWLGKGKSDELPYGTGEEQHSAIIKVYDTLVKDLRQLNLPLSIHSVQGISPVFRYSEVFPTSPFHGCDHCGHVIGDYYKPQPDRTCSVPAMEVLCTLESSGKWPDDLDAISHLKAAFLAVIADGLSEKHITTRVSPNFLDVFKEGFVFRVKLGYRKEIQLLRSSLDHSGKRCTQESEKANLLEKEIILLPKLASHLQSIQQINGVYGATVRLALRWIQSQLLGEHFQIEVIELLVAHLFLHPGVYAVPCSPQVGFIRFLYLLSSFDWNQAPLVINFNKELSKEDLSEITTTFQKNRPTLPGMVLVTPMDRTGSCWTKPYPKLVMLKRAVLLAKQSYGLLIEHWDNIHLAFDIKQIFRPPLEQFNLVIHLRSKMLSSINQAVDLPEGAKPHSHLSTHKNKSAMPVTSFDLALRYLKNLKDSFGDIAQFFYDVHGGCFIAVIWRPTAISKKEFKVSNMNCRKPEESSFKSDEIQLELNKEAIIEDMKIIGKGIIQTVQVLS